MVDFEVRGLVFDLDDTLVDNQEHTGNGLHERSRLEAAQTVGTQFGIESLANYSEQANAVAFRRAKVHSNESAFWYILVDTGVVSPQDAEDTQHELIAAMITVKDDVHERLIRSEAKPLPYVTEFLEAASHQGIGLAIASTAIRRHIDAALETTGLTSYFHENRRVSFEKIKAPKPDPQVYNLAFQSLDLEEDDRVRTCAFDDDPRGIASARAAGLFVCAIATRHSVEKLLSLSEPPNLAATNYMEYAETLGINI